MNFFINTTYNEKNSGIEHAQIKRAKLFRNNKAPFKLIFRDWNPREHFYLNAADIKDDEILNMFDFFQETENFDHKKINVMDIDFGVSGLTYNDEPNNHRYIVMKDNAIVARVRYFDESISKDKQVSAVEYFDGFGNLYRVDFYDTRGFQSMVEWYTPDNKVATDVWYDTKHRPVLETYYRKNAKGKMEQSSWKIIEKDGPIKIVDNIDDVVFEFLNKVNDKYFSTKEPNVFVLDRTNVADWMVPKLHRPAYYVMHLHNSQVGDPQKPDTSILNNNYEFPLFTGNDYDAIITATEKQRKDVIRRFKPLSKVFTIAVGIVPNEQFEQPRIPMSARKQNSILATARIAPEKQFGDLVSAMGIAKKEIPDISLDLYGYLDHSQNDRAKKEIDKAIKKYDLKDQVHIHGYTKDVAKIQNQYQVYGLTSIMEGFNLALMEATSHGEVGVTYDVNYGPNELIQNEQNGYVVDYGDYKALGEKLIYLFKHKDVLQKMSDASYDLAKRYSEESVWNEWKSLLDDAKAGWDTKLNDYREPIKHGLNQMEE
ncbi:accessory Sec system glycosyltransferase Asp1 [Apilactobacillus sp. M161]|uniref:Accessory Sec system glycosyltransferase Asp1 n=1 Tax=Apilactobacillus xinyiensis TaxID=2841032 RepID=A0ABT0I309_9LACO|nr:accessory Sec system glycosyltransferase Asp1 [Apilactobacillus xinyiensis]